MTSPLLVVPREIRDLIYEHVLVRDIILIERAAATVPESAASRSPAFYRELAQLYPLTRKRAHRRVWSIPRFDLGLPCFKDDPEPPPSAVQMTYQLSSQCDLSLQDRIEVNLLQTCKQIYHEAREVFYSKNVFGFKMVESIPTAFAFLSDRPAESLKLVSFIDIALDEGTNLQGTDEAHYPVVARSTDSVVLRYAYNHFTDLCTLLSTSRVGLRKLALVIDSSNQFYRTSFSSPADHIKWEKQRMTRPRPWVAAWVYPLLKLDNLEHLEICWKLDRPEIGRIADTLALMRRHMLVQKGSQRRGSLGCFCNPTFEFRIKFPIVTQEISLVDYEFFRKDLLPNEDEDDSADGHADKNVGYKNIGVSQSSEAWRQHMRHVFQASDCL